MNNHGPTHRRATTYRLLKGFRGSVDDPPLKRRPTGEPQWHMYDEQAVHLATFGGEATDAIRSAMRLVTDRGDFGTGDWFLVGDSEYEFRLNATGIALRTQPAHHSQTRTGSATNGTPPPPTAESLATELRSRGWTAWPRIAGDGQDICEIDDDERGHAVDLNIYFDALEPIAWVIGVTTHQVESPITTSDLADRIVTTIREDTP